MTQERFDFSFAGREWKWSKRVGDDIICESALSFKSLNDCISDARSAGFHASVDTRKLERGNSAEMPLSSERA